MSEGRFELKYAIERKHRDKILDLVTSAVKPDPHGRALREVTPGAGSKHPAIGYAVHSLYFDEPNLEGYSRRLAEARIRNRVRIRTYGHPGETQPIWLESKRKLGRKVIKQRIRVGDSDAWAQGDAARPWELAIDRAQGDAQRAATRWKNVVDNREMRPVCVVHYLRECYQSGRARLTLDHRVRASAAGSVIDYRGVGDVPIIPEDWLVLELKFDDFEPAWMHDICHTLGLTEEPISKFALGVAHIHRSDRPGELRYLTPHSLLRRGATT